jgi:hypothetical protein
MRLRIFQTNVLKNDFQSCLKLKTLDVLVQMRMSLGAIEVENMDWKTIFDILRNNKDHQIVKLDFNNS